MGRSPKKYTSISGSNGAFLLAASFVVIGLLSATPFSYAKKEEDPEVTRQRMFREQYERAGRAYTTGDYAAAIPALQAAFAIQPAPQLLFNIAQAYRKLDKVAQARVYFELFRSMATDIEPATSEEVDRYIVELRERENQIQAPKIVEKTKLLYVQSEKPLPKFLRPLGITAGVLGIGMIAGGAAFLGLDGRCANDPVAPALQCEQIYNTRTPGAALTAVGAGALALGIITFSLSFKRPPKPTIRVEEAPPKDEAMPTLPTLQQVMKPEKKPAPQLGPDGEPPPAGWHLDGTKASPK